MTSLKIDNQTLRRAFEALAMPTAAPGRLHLIGVRGAIPAGDGCLIPAGDAPNLFNDTIGLWGSSLALFRGSVDPGEHYTRHPLRPEGCAHLLDGCWQYRPGLHREHDALVQAEPVRVWRDFNRNHRREPRELVHEGWFGLNIHAAGSTIAVGAWSAGCQVIAGGWKGAAWRHFLGRCHESGQSRFSYYLTSFDDILRHHAA